MTVHIRYNVRVNVPNLEQQNQRQTEKSIKETVEFGFRTVKQKTPVKTGTLKGGYRKIVQPRLGKIINPVKYLPFVEKDTDPHIIRGNPLAFQIGGQTVFARFANHPGSKGKHMVRDTVRLLRKQSVIIFRKNLSKVGTRFG